MVAGFFWGRGARSFPCTQCTSTAACCGKHGLFFMQEIDEALEAAKKGSEPPIADLWNNIYVAGLGARLRPIEVGRPPIILPE